MAETLRDLGVVVDHPEPEHLRGRRGRRRVAVRAARGGGQDARQLHPARPAPGPLRAGHHQQPGRRPDRPPAGQPPRRRDARARRRDRVPQRLLLRDRARPAARRRGPASRSCRSWAPRTRCSPRPSPTATRPSARPPRSPRSTTSSRSSSRWAPTVERTAPDTIEVEGRKRLRGAEHRVIPDRIEAGTFVVAGGGHRRQGHARGRAVRPPRGVPRDRRAGRRRRRPAATDTIEVDGSALGGAGYRACDIETAPYPGLATDLQPPTSVLLTQAEGDVARPRDDLRGPPRVARRGAPDGRRGRHDRRPARHHHRPGRAPRRRGRDRRPAGRRVADPGRAGRRGHLHHPRCAPRSPGL